MVWRGFSRGTSNRYIFSSHCYKRVVIKGSKLRSNTAYHTGRHVLIFLFLLLFFSIQIHGRFEEKWFQLIIIVSLTTNYSEYFSGACNFYMKSSGFGSHYSLISVRNAAMNQFALARKNYYKIKEQTTAHNPEEIYLLFKERKKKVKKCVLRVWWVGLDFLARLLPARDKNKRAHARESPMLKKALLLLSPSSLFPLQSCIFKLKERAYMVPTHGRPRGGPS